VRSSIILGLIIGAAARRARGYFLAERETTITRDAKAEEIRETVGAVKPLVKELKDFKELQK
jgi:hypothetical protein